MQRTPWIALRRALGGLGLLGLATACTQLFGGEQNTLAPIASDPASRLTPSPLLPGAAPAICTPGETRCEGALLQTCADDLTSWVTLQRCGAAALCQALPATCLAATCSEDEMTCSSAILQKCNLDRTGWDLFATCLSPAHCNADQRQCLTEPCSVGQRRCDRSDVDQSPSLEVCRDDRLDWAPLDACVTRQLCDQTLTTGTPGGGLIVGTDGMVGLQAPVEPQIVLKCNLPACNVGEVRCEGARLQYCSEGRTGWLTAEECASAALCAGSLSGAGVAGVPACLPPLCAAGQHRCNATGVLQICSEDRTGFRDLQSCIGPPFCNAVLADQGQPGCRDAPCEANQMQCNGAQIQVCREDRTALDDAGAACESSALCNADDPGNAFCEDALCRRGATSGNEFHCEGAELQRCNESLTAYDTIQTCVTPALCDASQRFNGCRPPACQRGQHACSGGFLQTCNADQTGFENTENCGSQAQCDANAGRCADPCEPGATRCNASTGDLERCTDRLTGWQPIADCASLALCDEANGRCNICLGGQFSCADGQLRQCAGDGRTFARQNIGPECATTADGRPGVRVCQGNSVAVTPCPNGCTNGRCNECQGNATRCAGSQIQRCANGFFGNPTSCSDGNACNGVEACSAASNNCADGPDPVCGDDGNPCTNNFCDPARGCAASNVADRTQCVNGDIETCRGGAFNRQDCGQLGCNAGSTSCNECNAGRCINGNSQFQACNGGRFATAVTCNDTDGNVCTGITCDAARGCVPTQLSNVSCSDGNACTGNEVCQNGQCSNPADVVCPPLGVCRTNTCNPQTGACNPGNAANGTSCNNGAGTCQGGTCRTCTPNAVTCTNNQESRCNAAGDGATNRTCANGCGANGCRTCTPGTFAGCAGTTAFNRCNTAGSGNEQVPCGGGQTCDAGRQGCVTPPPPRVCTPNAVISCSNVAVNAGTFTLAQPTVVRCNADGTATASSACPAGQICGSGTLGCVVCEPNSRICAGFSSVNVCNATGTVRTEVACPPPPQGMQSTCNAGVCGSAPPVPIDSTIPRPPVTTIPTAP